jgi:arsenite methyltransferase
MTKEAGVSDIREDVRERYAAAATGSQDCCGSECCGPSGCSTESVWGGSLYDEAVRAEAPDRAVLASLGCGNPTAVAELREGEVVLDLGSGGGLDVLLSAKRVGPTGKAYGLDMTDEMLALALENKARAGVEKASGFESVQIEDTHSVADGFASAIIRARKPGGA